MNLLPLLVNLIPGMSPQTKELVSHAAKALSGYQNTKQDLLRAMAERNIRVQDLQGMLPYLQSGLVHNILNTVAPGSPQRLTNLCNSLISESSTLSSSSGSRWANPFPSLK